MPAIEFDNISKQYRLGVVSSGTISHDLNRWWTMHVLRREDPFLKVGETNDRSQRGHSDYVWALRDINFSVEQGDVVGIIGKNGAGKSTLLKLLSRVTSPTTGEIRVRGRIASLLEVGTGFHPEMTGRENIYMNGAIMGMTKQEITRKLDEIVDFSGCERYIDTPVKRYSSGMTVRLGFAIAAHLDPEILVVDEVLAVGDAEFQKKAIGKMQDVAHGQGRTVLFVSHNMNAVKRLCHHGIVLQDGMIEKTGTAEECVDHYLSSGERNVISHAVITEKHSTYRDYYHRKIEFNEVWLLNPCPTEMANDEPLNLKVSLTCHQPVSTQIAVGITNEYDARVAYYLSSTQNFLKPGSYTMNIQIQQPSLPRGAYRLRFEAINLDFRQTPVVVDKVVDVLSFYVKHIHQSLHDEVLYWQSSWGQTLHNQEGMEIQLHL